MSESKDSKEAKKKKGLRGRPRKYRTPEEAKEAKKAHNKKYQRVYLETRRDRYASDPNYRKKRVLASRAGYRKSSAFTPKLFGVMAGKANLVASPFELVFSGEGNTRKIIRRRMVCLDGMARVIGISNKVLPRWVSDGRFPRPPYLTSDGQRVYSVSQADSLAACLRDGLKSRGAFRRTDADVIAALHACVS